MIMTEQDAIKVLAFIAKHNLHDHIWWRCDGEYAPITIWVNCNDLFYWAQADAEDLNIGDLPILEQAIVDLSAIDDVLGACYSTDLYCCRKRQMRPQKPAYPTRNTLG